MTELLRANILADFAFFRRSRLLLAFMLLFLLLTGLQSLPPLFANSGVQSFNALQQIFSELNGFLLVLCACLGLLAALRHAVGGQVGADKALPARFVAPLRIPISSYRIVAAKFCSLGQRHASVAHLAHSCTTWSGFSLCGNVRRVGGTDRLPYVAGDAGAPRNRGHLHAHL